ncbi:hypothetical protein [Planobispora rosea]|uniref:hypothetical protein n=1 Tax=Planobispora rosea TaxID=35762 RepID=UPI00083B70CB|nr:hypothetical protein [Planobispora rosea]
MYAHATPTVPTVHYADLLGFTPEEAALILTAFSVPFVILWRTDTTPTATEIRHELATVLAENPRGEIYEAMALLLKDDGGPHPDDIAHLDWCRRIIATRVSAGSVTA